MQRYKKEIPRLKNYSNFVVFFKHHDIGDGHKSPCMMIGNPKFPGSYAIPLAHGFEYADSITGEPTDKLIMLSVAIVNQLRLCADKQTAYKVISAVIDNLPDLITMPPASQMTQKELMSKAESQGLVMKLNGNTVIDAS